MTQNIAPRSIILIDDEADLVQLFSEALKSAGLDAIPFDDPMKALEYVRKNHRKIALVLTDRRMPQINGLEMSKRWYLQYLTPQVIHLLGHRVTKT